MKTFRFSVVLILLAAAAGTAQVRTWVSPTGLDANPCTREQPCRNFAAAIALVALGGEVVAMESGGYGAVQITKPVTLLAPDGVHAAIAPTTGSAIRIEVAGNEDVVLRNLFLNSQGAFVGIEVMTVLNLVVERSVISGFAFDGIHFVPTNTNAHLHVSDTVVRRTPSGRGIVIGNNSLATIDSVEAYDNFAGIVATGARALVRNSVAASGNSGFQAIQGGRMMIENSVATNNATGFFALSGGWMTLMRCASTSNSLNGVRASGTDSTIWLSLSTIAGNGTAAEADNGGVVRTRQDNTVEANTIVGTLSPFLPN